jgi:co-chaperonin GroES (HSP10)
MSNASNINPKFDYLLCEEVKEVSGVVTSTEISDHWQKYRVLAVGPGRYQEGTFVPTTTEVNDVIYVQKHAEADSPEDLKQRGLHLIMESRVMANVEA